MDTPRWVTDAVFYEIFPDRFARSDRVPKSDLNLETWDSPPTVYGFKGGDLYGVLARLDLGGPAGHAAPPSRKSSRSTDVMTM